MIMVHYCSKAYTGQDLVEFQSAR